MNIDLIINGTLALIIFKDGIEVKGDELKDINDKLTNGKIFIDLRKRTIVDFDCMVDLYTFDIDVLDSTEYEFELNLE
jgi:hypothetical protein